MTVLEQVKKKSENQYFRTFHPTVFETFENIDFQRSTFFPGTRHFSLKLSYKTKVVSWQCTFSVLYCAIFTVRPKLTIPCSCNQIGREEMWNYSTTLFQKKCHNSLGNGGSLSVLNTMKYHFQCSRVTLFLRKCVRNLSTLSKCKILCSPLGANILFRRLRSAKVFRIFSVEAAYC